MQRSESYIFPARRAQWIVSCLAYHYGLDRGVENEIVVLAAGLDQYLQEIYHHLDSSANGKLPAQDFKILCEILGLVNHDIDKRTESDNILLKDLPDQVDFKTFHLRLGEYFASQSDTNYTPIPECSHDAEQIDREVRVRHPRTGLTIHTMCVECFSSKPITEIYKSLLHKQGKNESEITDIGQKHHRKLEGHVEQTDVQQKKDDELKVLQANGESDVQLRDTKRLRRELANRKEENESLREVIEDMRLALQSSDARSLVMQVALRKNHLKHKNCDVKKSKFHTRSPIAPSRSFDALIHELNHLRESRDSQLEEAMIFTQQLEMDLLRSRKELLELEYCNNVLMGNQRVMYQELGKARKTVCESLAKVRELEEQSRLAAEQESKLLAIQQHLVTCSLTDSCDHDGCTNTKQQSKCNGEEESDQSERTSPAGDSDTSGGDNQSEGSTTSDEFFRAVEGRAASDEEHQWQEQKDGSFQTTDVDVTIEKLKLQNDRLKKELQKSEEARQAIEEEMEENKADMCQEIQMRIQDCETLQYELQTLETERVRLSLIEETLAEIIALLRELRMLKMSRRSLGKIVMDTIDICHSDDRDIDPEHDVRNFINCLHKQLVHCDILQQAFAARQALAKSRMEPCTENQEEEEEEEEEGNEEVTYGIDRETVC
ncbi:EF-hand and coiled-coil domain-containing protein 1-like [Glandiceps talaboti]